MTNIGHNPTFNHNDIITIETNIIDFEGDLYGKEIAIFFYKQIRPEKKFSSIDDLKRNLKKSRFCKKKLAKINYYVKIKKDDFDVCRILRRLH